MPAKRPLRPRILLIEDNVDRIALFRQWLADTPYLPVEVTSGGQAMGMLHYGADGVAGICLDHDLNSQPRTLSDEWVSGSDVVSLICRKVPKTVPILVHSMNTVRAPDMVKRLSRSGFSVTRIRMVILNRANFNARLANVTDSWESVSDSASPTSGSMRDSALPPWVIFHIPHDSTEIPAEVLDQFVLDGPAFRQELLHMTDHHTLALFAGASASPGQIVRAPVSRLVVDVERFEDDEQESMARCGMGAVYTHTSCGAPLRHPLSPIQRQALIASWYRPHHARLAQVVQNALDVHGRATVIDAHSFPSMPLPYESNQSLDRPQVCIGSDDFHTPLPLRDAFVEIFRAAGYEVRLNTPFAGALVPSMHYRRDSRVTAILVELNRSLYMEESTGERNQDFDRVSASIQQCVREAIAIAT